MVMQVGKKFSSFSSFKEALDIYSETIKCHFWLRDSQKLENCKLQRAIGVNKELVYYRAKFTCVYGGRKCEKRKDYKGERNSKTYRNGCQAYIKLTLSSDGQNLEIADMHTEHNHDIEDKLYRLHPQERKLPPVMEERVNDLLNLQANKKLVQAEVMKLTDKIVLLKDISNISTKFKPPSVHVEEIVNILKEKHRCNVDILHNDNCLQGIFIQDKEMNDMFDLFPEVIFFDGTYKLIDIRFVCYIFLIEDGNGSSEIVGLGLLARKDKKSLEWLVDAFKQKNNNWRQTRVIMTDKDLSERKVFKEKFPDANLSICLFHVLQTFKREITSEKMKLTCEEVQKVKDLLIKMCYADTEEKYNDAYDEFIKFSAPVVEYFNKNWHPIREEWTLRSSANGSFLNKTNNRLESMNSKLKSIIKPYSNLQLFFDNFFILLLSLRNERDAEAADAILKTTSMQLSDAERLYSELLQPYPFSLLLPQLRAANHSDIVEVSPQQYWFSRDGILFQVDMNSCDCIFSKSMKMPCRHVFSLRKKLNKSLFDSALIHKRWSKQYVRDNHRIFNKIIDSPNVEVSVVEKSKDRPKTRHERFKSASILTNQIAEVLSESTGDAFQHNLKFLEDVLLQLKTGRKLNFSVAESVVNSENEKDDESLSIKSTPLLGTGAISSQYFADSKVCGSNENVIKMDRESDSCSLSNICLPKGLKRKGRPKGFDKTVIGLPKKKKKCLKEN